MYFYNLNIIEFEENKQLKKQFLTNNNYFLCPPGPSSRSFRAEGRVEDKMRGASFDLVQHFAGSGQWPDRDREAKKEKWSIFNAKFNKRTILSHRWACTQSTPIRLETLLVPAYKKRTKSGYHAPIPSKIYKKNTWHLEKDYYNKKERLQVSF